MLRTAAFDFSLIHFQPNIHYNYLSKPPHLKHVCSSMIRGFLAVLAPDSFFWGRTEIVEVTWLGGLGWEHVAAGGF